MSQIPFKNQLIFHWYPKQQPRRISRFKINLVLKTRNAKIRKQHGLLKKELDSLMLIN